ncbi:MAG: substrate-binding domain-containing protein, partial [Hoeflea sp.]|nr:substrate-binding domain-containing protein [Hoeflea sp.]
FQLGFLRPVVTLPDVEVVLRSGGLADLLRELEALRLDVVLVNQVPQRDSATPWISHKLADQQVSLVGTPGRVGETSDLKTLLADNPIILPSLESGVRTSFDALADRLGVRPRIAAEVDDMAMMRLMAREDVGLAVVPPIVVNDELKNGLLREASRLPGLQETFYAVTQVRRFPNPLVKQLLKTDVI